MLLRSMLPLIAYTLILFAGSAPAQDTAPPAEITGTVAYRQRSALPPDAVVQVRLEDVSRQDASASLIAEEKIKTTGKQVPIPFRLTYDPAKIEPSHTYHVRAMISSGERMMFTSTTAYPVITWGAPTTVAIMVQQAAASSKSTGSLMEGEFVYLADAGLFTDCRTGVRYPVAQEEDNASLERAYSATRSAPRAPVLVVVEGRIELRPKTDGEGSQETLVIARFDRVRSGETCATANPATALEGTYWKLTELNGEAVTDRSGGREAHLVLRPEGKLGGAGGCNGFFGSYKATQARLRLVPGGSTMMACPEPLMKQEQEFIAAITSVTGYRIAGDTLELFCRDQVVARFTAGHPK